MASWSFDDGSQPILLTIPEECMLMNSSVEKENRIKKKNFPASSPHLMYAPDLKDLCAHDPFTTTRASGCETSSPPGRKGWRSRNSPEAGGGPGQGPGCSQEVSPWLRDRGVPACGPPILEQRDGLCVSPSNGPLIHCFILFLN